MLVLGAGGFAKEFIKILLLDQFEYNEMAVFLDNKRGLPLLEILEEAHRLPI